MRVLVTGANGFIGRNLTVRLAEHNIDVVAWNRDTSIASIRESLPSIDWVVHLAAANRPATEDGFVIDNADFTQTLVEVLSKAQRPIPLIFSSSSQVLLDNSYGKTKRIAEETVCAYGERSGASVSIYRLSGVFGKWCKPNYNSVVATFCHNIAQGLSISISDPAKELALVYIDDVVTEFVNVILAKKAMLAEGVVVPQYQVSLATLAEKIRSFTQSRVNLTLADVGTGFDRALYATYVSYLQPKQFSYTVPRYVDPRGEFAELVKHPDAGQVSYFTAHAGITRGGHYHHTKTEKFLVIRGQARFCFRHLITNETYELLTQGGDGRVVETIPGWVHDITNIGTDELIVMLWANEIFDRAQPDTVAARVI